MSNEEKAIEIIKNKMMAVRIPTSLRQVYAKEAIEALKEAGLLVVETKEKITFRAYGAGKTTEKWFEDIEKVIKKIREDFVKAIGRKLDRQITEKEEDPECFGRYDFENWPCRFCPDKTACRDKSLEKKERKGKEGS